MRSAVCEIVETAPLAPTVDDLAGRTTPHPPRSRLLLPSVAVLIVAAATVLTLRHDDPIQTNPPMTLELPTPLPRSAELAATDAFGILRKSTAAVDNMETLAGPLIESCMAARGFTFIPTGTVLMGEQDQDAFLLQRYPEPRQENGMWGYYFEAAESRTSDSETTLPSSLTPPGYIEAMQGKTVLTMDVLDVDGNVVTVGDGCYGQAMTTIFGSDQAYVTFFAQLSRLEVVTGQAWSALHTDPDYVTLNLTWAACMQNASFDYQTIFDPPNRYWESPRPTTEEQQVAAADWQCRQGNHLDGADLLRLEEQILTDLLAANPIGNYEAFELQVDALTAGQVPTEDTRTATLPTSTTPG